MDDSARPRYFPTNFNLEVLSKPALIEILKYAQHTRDKEQPDLVSRFVNLIVSKLPWWKRFLLKRLLKGLFLVLLLTTPVSSSELIVHGDGFTLQLPDKPIGEIQEYHGRMRDAKRYEEQVAVLIAMGHVWHKQIRDSQQSLIWYIGRIYPDIDIPGEFLQIEQDRLLRYEIPYTYIEDVLECYGKPFNWPPGQELVLVFKDGSRLSAELIIASEGVILDLNPYKPRETVYIYPLKRSLRFMDFMRILPSRDHFVLPVWCGFPRRPRIDGKPWRWDPKEVVAIELKGGTDEEAEPGTSGGDRIGYDTLRATD